MSNNSETSLEFVAIGQLSAADFEANLNTEFLIDLNYFGISVDGTPVRATDVYPADASVKLLLLEVSRREPLSPHLRQEPFILLFQGSHEFPLHSGMHLLTHETLGNVSLLLTAVNAELGIHPEYHPEGRFYETVVN